MCLESGSLHSDEAGKTSIRAPSLNPSYHYALPNAKNDRRRLIDEVEFRHLTRRAAPLYKCWRVQRPDHLPLEFSPQITMCGAR